MKKVLGISDNQNAYFYEIDINNLENIVSELYDKYYFQKRDVVLCDFYNETHNYGRYQNDINNGYANVMDIKIRHIDRREYDKKIANSVPHFGVLELTITYQSQIAKIIKNTFSADFYNENYKIIDFTDMIKVVNAIDGISNDFTYDSVVDKRLKYMNTSFNYNKKDITNINKEIFLNEKEKVISLDEYYNTISKLADNMNVKLVATYNLNQEYNQEIENMKRYAVRNSKLIEMPIFNPILRKLPVSFYNDEYNNKKKKIIKKIDYTDNYNVYLQNGNNYDII